MKTNDSIRIGQTAIPVKPEAGPADLSTLARGGGALLAASLFGNGVNYGLGILLARLLGAEAFGRYALSLALFNALVMMVLLGFNSGVIKFVSEHLGLNQPLEAKRIVVTGMIWCGGSALLAGGALWAGADWLATSVYTSPDLSLLFQFIALALPLSAVSMLMVSSLQAFQTIRYTILVKYVWEPIGKFGAAWLVILLGFGLPGVLAGMVMVLAGSVLMALHGFQRVISLGMRDVASLTSGGNLPFVWYCLPLILANVFSAVAPRVDVFLLGYFGQMVQVGMYSAAFQTAAVLSLVLGAFDRTFAPAMGRLLATGDTKQLGHLYRTQTRMVTGLLMCPLIVFLVLGEDVLRLFGSGFSGGYFSLAVLAVAQGWFCATGSARMVLLMSGQSRLVLANTLVMSVCLVALCWVLVPLWGMEGAAVAAGLSLVGTGCIQVVEVRWRHGMFPYSWGYGKFLLAGGGTAVMLLMAKSWLGGLSLWMGLPLTVLCYLGLVMGLGLEPDDRRVVVDLWIRMTRMAGRSGPKEPACV
jgi:O-antigen/teichoic acid export membrane protein